MQNNPEYQIHTFQDYNIHQQTIYSSRRQQALYCTWTWGSDSQRTSAYSPWWVRFHDILHFHTKRPAVNAQGTPSCMFTSTCLQVLTCAGPQHKNSNAQPLSFEKSIVGFWEISFNKASGLKTLLFTGTSQKLKTVWKFRRKEQPWSVSSLSLVFVLRQSNTQGWTVE